MEKILINGHNQIVFSNEEKELIKDLYINQNYSMRALSRYFNCTQKPMRRVLQELNIDYSRGNLSAFKSNIIIPMVYITKKLKKI